MIEIVARLIALTLIAVSLSFGLMIGIGIASIVIHKLQDWME